jgi:hypothetical protein
VYRKCCFDNQCFASYIANKYSYYNCNEHSLHHVQYMANLQKDAIKETEGADRRT